MSLYGKKSQGSLKWFFVLPLMAFGILFLCLYTLNDYSVYFYTPKELVLKAKELSKKEIRVGGMVKTSSVHWDQKDLNLNFILSDLKGAEILVFYKGAPPDMFKEGSGVVVEGYIREDGKELTARNLFVKHSEEYKIPEDIHQINPQLVEKSIIKDELL